MIILAGQTILMVVFAWAMFFIFGKTYDAVMLCAGRHRFLHGFDGKRLSQYAGYCREIRFEPEGVAHH